jgi:eukaryotic-like serine/threonine-protein kinase
VSSIDPEVFGELLLVRRLADSPMAETVVAVRLGDRSGITYVVKRPRLGERASGAAAQAILRETEVLGAVSSPHLVALESSGTVGGLPYLVLEYLRGAPLDRILAHGALGEAETRAIVRDVLGGLQALDEKGWVHGDVAPSNVVVDETGESRLIDFGIARRKG